MGTLAMNEYKGLGEKPDIGIVAYAAPLASKFRHLTSQSGT
jgi:hypothetical protein